MTREIIEQGEKRLAVLIGKNTASRSLAKLTALRGSPGRLVTGLTIQEWKFEGFSEIDDELFLYGPFLSGKTLEDVLDLGLSDALPSIALLVGSLISLAENGVPLFPIQTDSVFFTEEGGVLFFPPEVYRELRGIRTFEANRDTFETLNHPDFKNDALASFSIAAVLYRLSTGKFPYEGLTAVEIHEETRKREVLEPDRIVPEITGDFSSSVMAGLSGSRPGLTLWKEKLAGWVKAPPLRQLAPEEKERILRTAETQSGESERRFRRRLFWEKNWKIVAAVAAGVVILALVLGSILRGVLAPRVTHGFTPAKVVETYYLSMNSLNESAMSACVIGGAGRNDISAVTNLFVISRVTLGYEGRSNIVSADEWEKEGKPELPSPRTVFGVTDLSISRVSGGADPEFQVVYDKWMPRSDSGDASQATSAPPLGPTFMGTKTTDLVFLKKDREDWVIYRIDRQKEEPIAVP
jgi:hypothetical protein